MILQIKKLDIFLKKKISLIINLAAQAGVRYSLIKPTEYVDNNVLGFYNIISAANKYKVKRIIYASSSSVYGDSVIRLKTFNKMEFENV